MALLSEFNSIRRQLVRLVDELGDASGVAGSDTGPLIDALLGIERAATAARLVVSHQGAKANAWRESGAPSAQAWAAAVTGETTAAAAQHLATGARLAQLDETRRKLAHGELSPTQASIVADAASADPAAEERLLSTAVTRSTSELASRAREIRHAASDDLPAIRERVHRSRYLRTWSTRDGAFEGHFRLCTDHGAILNAALAPLRREAFEQAQREGRREADQAHLADALVALARPAAGATAAHPEREQGGDADIARRSQGAPGTVDSGQCSADADVDTDTDTGVDTGTGTATDTGTGTGFDTGTGTGRPRRPRADHRPPATIHVRVDHRALVRGRLEAGETCRIDDVGPVPVAVARHLACDAAVELTVMDGPEVVEVKAPGRTVPAPLRRLLEERDPSCVVPGCPKRRHLEIHHLVPWSLGGPTTLDNLARLCSHHHDQISYHGYHLTGPHPHWTWHPPPSTTRRDRPSSPPDTS